MEIFVQVLLAVLLVGAAVALIFWDKILVWTNKALFPWIRENFSPELEFKVRNAFAPLEKVVTPIYGNIKTVKKFTEIKKAWEMLREYLLKVLVQFDLNVRNEWVKQITYWVIRYLRSNQEQPLLKKDVVDFPPESNKPEVVRVVTEEIVGVDLLPPDVRQQWLKRGNTTQDFDVTQLRDRQIDECERELKAAMTN